MRSRPSPMWRRSRLERLKKYYNEGSGYFQIQATRPLTIAYALNDSPVGQLAWIVDKFKEWTFPTSELPEQAINRDRMLTNVMIYWLTGTGASSAQMYYESMHSQAWDSAPLTTPTGVAVFAEDVAIRRYGEQGFNIVHWSDFESRRSLRRDGSARPIRRRCSQLLSKPALNRPVTSPPREPPLILRTGASPGFARLKSNNSTVCGGTRFIPTSTNGLPIFTCNFTPA